MILNAQQARDIREADAVCFDHDGEGRAGVIVLAASATDEPPALVAEVLA